MKFYKTTSGRYINVHRITNLKVHDSIAINDIPESYIVKALIDDIYHPLFESYHKEEAEKWLDDFVKDLEKLNG